MHECPTLLGDRLLSEQVVICHVNRVAIVYNHRVSVGV